MHGIGKSQMDLTIRVIGDKLVFMNTFLINNLSNGDRAEAEDAEAAFVAYHQLHRDAGLMGTRVMIINQETERIIWEDK